MKADREETMTTLKARATLEARDREFRIKELRRLLTTYQRDPNFSGACMTWRRELSDLRVEQETLVPSAPVKDITWPEAQAHARAVLKRERGMRTPPRSVAEVREHYYRFLRERPFIRGY
jgi:hypothetical protein